MRMDGQTTSASTPQGHTGSVVIPASVLPICLLLKPVTQKWNSTQNVQRRNR